MTCEEARVGFLLGFLAQKLWSTFSNYTLPFMNKRGKYTYKKLRIFFDGWSVSFFACGGVSTHLAFMGGL